MDVAADEAGVATIRVASIPIPKLNFKYLAATAFASPTAGKEKYMCAAVVMWCLVHGGVNL